MSTYLKTAAMSLLSRTLQTFLSKYLSDVDVEGVALPSVYDGSGWGVRLSNVKLREGVELMKQMPGSMIKKRKRKMRRRQRRRQPKSVSSHPIENSTTNNGDQPVYRSEKLKEDSHSSRGRTYSSSMSPPIMPTVDEVTKESSGSFYASDDDDDDDDDTGANGRPITPAQERQSFLSCFSSKRTTVVDEKVAKRKSVPLAEGLSSDDAVTNDDASSKPKRQFSAPEATMTLPSADPKKNEEGGTQSSRKQNSELDAEDDEYGDKFEDEEEEYEQPVRLCLGANGRIGILDVRLIGKELRVMVEDANVTIEAIPILQAENHDDDDGNDDLDENGKSTRETSEDTATSAEAGAKSAAEKKTPKTKSEPKRDTVGDRVLADNPIARLISTIPHLFLRDVRIRIIVRDQAVKVVDEKKGTTDEGNATTATDNGKNLTKAKPSDKDTMLEIGVDFLSVTSGEDVLSHFHEQTEGGLDSSKNVDQDSSNQPGEKPPPLLKIPSHVSADATNAIGPDHKNEYLVRHIRTGRGPEGGIFLQIYAPAPKLHPRVSAAPGGGLWARQQWILATNLHFLRFSGLDIQARVHMGTRKPDNSYSWFYGEYVEEDEETSDIESMLLFGGIDSVAPGPQLPLPPIEPRMSRGTTFRKSIKISEGAEAATSTQSLDDAASTARAEMDAAARSSLHPGADLYEMDKNGIQSCKVPSLFHRASRGMELASCKDCTHLPSEVCELCWRVPSCDVKKDSALDSSMPMPGLVLQIGFRDPLEVNVDRLSLESLGLLKSLFTKPRVASADEDANVESDENGTLRDSSSVTPARPSQLEEATQGTSTTTGFFSGIFYGASKEEIKEEEPSDAFETYMQPEKITVLGICLPEVLFRVHVMKPLFEDRAHGFCYWDVVISCLTIDYQALEADERAFQDVKFDIARLVWKEYRGTNQKDMISLGLPPPPRRRTDSQTSASSMVDDHESTRPPWPSAACALLDIPPPLEIMAYKSRERHGLQLRYISISSPTNTEEAARSLVFLRLGVTSVDSPYSIKNEINHVIKEVLDYLVRARRVGKKDDEGVSTDPDDIQEGAVGDNKEPKASRKSSMSYTIQIDSGKVSLPPLLAVKLPMTRFSGERSSTYGFFFEAVLEKLDLAYGTTEPVAKKGCPTLPQIASLPESVRMHVLLCLKDLTPLEKAFGLKHEKNAFRRIKSVDKGMLKVAKKMSKRDSKHHRRKSSISATASSSRREEILSKLLSLDDSELNELWTVHQRYQRKLAKKRNEEV